MTIGDDIIGLLKAHGPMTDAELASRLKKVHQTINQTANKLAQQKRIIREDRGNGIINRLIGQRPTAPAPPPPETRDRITEDEVKTAVKEHLEARGYEVAVAWGRTRGIDIDAAGPDGRIIIEAKAEVPRPQQQVNYSLGALGELIQRMSDPDAQYALALPDHRQYRGLVERLPDLARERLKLTVYFVGRDKDGLKVSVEQLGSRSTPRP